MAARKPEASFGSLQWDCRLKGSQKLFVIAILAEQGHGFSPCQYYWKQRTVTTATLTALRKRAKTMVYDAAFSRAKQLEGQGFTVALYPA